MQAAAKVPSRGWRGWDRAGCSRAGRVLRPGPYSPRPSSQLLARGPACRLRCSPTRRAAAPSLASWEQAPRSRLPPRALTCPPYAPLLARGQALPAASDLEAAGPDACAGAAAGSGALPGAAGAHGAAPALEPVPVPILPLRSVGTSLPSWYPSLTRSGEVPPGRVGARALAPARSRGPASPRSPQRGLEPRLCLACPAMRGNSQFPRELLSPGQPCSPNIYISHYCLHMSLFSGGVSSFPLLPQRSPCSTSSGAASATLGSHYCLINLQAKAKLP